MVMRESSGSSVRATVRLSMLYPRELSRPVTRMRAPGLFSTKSEMTCSMGLPQNHFVDGAARGDHWVHVLSGRDLHVEEIGAGEVHGLLEGGREIARMIDGAAGQPVCGGEFLGIGEAAQLHFA